MGSKKTYVTNTESFAAPPPTVATTNLQAMVDKPVDYSTPIRNAYGRAEQSLSRSYQSPLGAYTTADVRDKSLRSQNADLQQGMGLDLSNAAQQNASDVFNRQATVAGLTSPVPYLSRSNTVQPYSVMDWVGTIGGIAAGAA